MSAAVPILSAAARTVGTLRFLPGDGELLPASGMWSINAEPTATMRLKALFRGATQDRRGNLHLSATDANARELSWALLRYPLEVSAMDRRRLERATAACREREEEVFQVLSGDHRHTGLLEPAREPFPYQLVAGDLAISTGATLIGDELGLGKTTEGALVLRVPEALPALVVCPPHLQRQWIEELAILFPELLAHIARRRDPYVVSRHPSMRGRDADVLIMSYAKLREWGHFLRGEVRTVIFDECQELRHDESQQYKAAGAVADGAEFKVGLSGTPIYNYGGEVHNVYGILAPGELGTRKEFAREWCGSDRWGPKVKVEDPAALGEYLRERGLMIARTRRDVGRELPGLIRISHEVGSDTDTLDAIIERSLHLARTIVNPHASAQDKFTAQGQFDWRMREATGIAKAPYVAEFTKMLLASEEKIVMWGWHHAVYNIWAEVLAEFNPVFYTGNESPTQKDVSKACFVGGDALAEARKRHRGREPLDESRVLIMSLRAGAGINGLQHVCKVGVFGEFDWSPKPHDQCLGRLDRFGQTDPVVGYFLHSRDGTDPAMMDLLGVKRGQTDPLMGGRAELLEAAPDHHEHVRAAAAAALKRRDRARAR